MGSEFARHEIKFPKIGFGTAGISNTSQGIEIIEQAISCGYRLLDTADVYENEAAVGKAVKKAETVWGIKRQELIISSKLANASQGYQSALDAFDVTLNRLEVDYLDMYLIHWPVPKRREHDYKELNVASWEAMEKLKRQGKIKMIGVCNFLPRHLENLMQNCHSTPQINQIEMHPRYHQKELVQYCKEKKIILEAWSPFQNGKILNDINLKKIADKHHATVAQICLKWIADHGGIPIPKSSSQKRMLENLMFENIALDDDDRETIQALDNKDGHADYWNYKRQLMY